MEIMIDWHGIAVAVRGELIAREGAYWPRPEDLYVEEICVGEESEDISYLLTAQAQDDIRDRTIRQIYASRDADEMDAAADRAEWEKAA